MNILQRTLVAGAIAGSLLLGGPAFAHPYAGPANQSTYTQATFDVNRLAVELDLTVQQQAQIQPFVTSYQQAQINVSSAERTAMLSVLTAQQLAQLQALGGGAYAWRQLNLTADQLAQLQNLHNQFDAQRLANWQTLVNNLSPYLTAAQLAELQGIAHGDWDDDDWDWDDDDDDDDRGGQGPAWSRPIPPGNGNPAWGRPNPPGNGNPAWDRDDDEHDDDDDDGRRDNRGNGKGKNKNR